MSLRLHFSASSPEVLSLDVDMQKFLLLLQNILPLDFKELCTGCGSTQIMKSQYCLLQWRGHSTWAITHQKVTIVTKKSVAEQNMDLPFHVESHGVLQATQLAQNIPVDGTSVFIALLMHLRV